MKTPHYLDISLWVKNLPTLFFSLISDFPCSEGYISSCHCCSYISPCVIVLQGYISPKMCKFPFVMRPLQNMKNFSTVISAKSAKEKSWLFKIVLRTNSPFCYSWENPEAVKTRLKSIILHHDVVLPSFPKLLRKTPD